MFPKLKEKLKGIRFNSTEEAKTAAKTWLKNKSKNYYKEGLNGWKHRLEKCIDFNGSYVEK